MAEKHNRDDHESGPVLEPDPSDEAISADQREIASLPKVAQNDDVTSIIAFIIVILSE
jgi:hypothetical protein